MYVFGNNSIPDPMEHHVKRRFRLFILLVFYEIIMFTTALSMFCLNFKTTVPSIMETFDENEIF